jgi:predicted NBD/HSP70 family sugar kinase/biotin operon repressor
MSSTRRPRIPEVATRQTSRAINQQVILNLLLAHQPVSRAELARRLGMQRSAAGRIVQDLIDSGLVREGSAGEGERGRKPTLLHLDSNGRCAVAVDVRRSRTYLVLTDLVGDELSPVRSFATERDPGQFILRLSAEVLRLLAEHPEVSRCHGVGVAFPGMLDKTGSTVVHAPALGWRNVPVKRPLAEALGLPVEMENAAKACALAQVWKSRGDNPLGGLVFVSVSDGVGVGLVVGGEILRGRHNVAGEFGHLPLSLEGPPCSCGAAGCWEAYVSNLATLSRYVGKPVLAGRALPPEIESLTVEDVVLRARAGDARAMMALHTTARYLGLGLASIVNALDPDRICVGGEITAGWDLIEAAVRSGLAERALVATSADVEIVPIPAEEHPRLKGAAALVGARVFVTAHAAPRASGTQSAAAP